MSEDEDYAYEYDEGEDADNEGEASSSKAKKICKITQNTNASNKKKDAPDAMSATQDARLKSFLSNADEIENIDHFVYWKDEFLKQFRLYLNPDGTATAREADEEIYFHLEKLASVCLDVKAKVSDGAITPERCSVKGQRSINELIASLQKIEDMVMAYWPKTLDEEEKIGYTKFELAAVLVRDGFRVYGLMVATRDYVQSLEERALKDVLKPNQRSIIQFYYRCLDSFAETMADLGMHKLMQKCVDIYRVRPRRKKKKKYTRDMGDALSDSSVSVDLNKGRMFSKAKTNTKAIMDNGWTSGTTRTEVRKPKGRGGGRSDDDDQKRRGKGKGDLSGSSGDDSDDTNDAKKKKKVKEESEEEEEVDYLYYFDPVNEVVAKVPRSACRAENLILNVDPDTGKETSEGIVEEWDTKDGVLGKTELIWKMKELLRGKARTKAGGLE